MSTEDGSSPFPSKHILKIPFPLAICPAYFYILLLSFWFCNSTL